jgi:hypothetical protein
MMKVTARDTQVYLTRLQIIEAPENDAPSNGTERSPNKNHQGPPKSESSGPWIANVIPKQKKMGSDQAASPSSPKER